jgi:glycerophosphoryl diester phosphodiesterase
MTEVPFFVAHRGESADAPENTLAAFRLAWERNVVAVEMDVHLTRDGELVVCHDAGTFRTTGVRKVIRECALDELRPLDAGRWKGERWRGEPIPTLGEALATVPPEGRCFIEVKSGPETVAVLAEVVRASGVRPEQLAVISFQAETVAEAKRRLPKVKAYYLSGFRQDPQTGAWSPGVEALIARAQEIGADGLDLSCDGPVDADFVQRVHAAGLEVYVWTVDSPEEARRLAAAGVDGITSNRAAALRDELASSAP